MRQEVQDALGQKPTRICHDNSRMESRSHFVVAKLLVRRILPIGWIRMQVL